MSAARRPRDRSGVRRDRRWLRVGAIVAALLAVVAVAVAAVVGLRDDDQPAAKADRPERVLALAPPPNLPKVGTTVDSRVRRDGDVQVVTWVRTKEPARRITLSVPDVVGLPRTARAVDVLVAGDRRFVGGRSTVTREARTVTFAEPSRLLYLSYTLRDVADRRATVPGRALVRLTALDLGFRPAGPTLAGIDGAPVLSVACLPRDQAIAVPCGAPDGDVWRVERRGPRRTDAVQPQVQIPRR